MPSSRKYSAIYRGEGSEPGYLCDLECQALQGLALKIPGPLAPDYLSQGPDLPGGGELAGALEGFPDRRYDAVFMGFWISHVPAERFASFWSLVADCLNPDGRVFFCDDAYRTEDELIDGPGSSTIRRHAPDGTAYRLVKVPHRPADLQSQLRRLGWHITVHPTAGPFYWGAGQRALGM